MSKGKLIVIEGTDCSGKETQAKLLLKKLKEDGIKIEERAFPMYDTPTGKIVGGALLGKPAIGESVFGCNVSKLDPKVAALYYAADRLYNINEIKELLNSGINVILDRYVESNMGHQAGKINDKKKQIEMMQWLEKLEYDLLELPKPDLVIFLFMPYQYTVELRNKRAEVPDEVEKDIDYLRNAEQAYSLMAEKYKYNIVYCVKDDKIRTIDDISDDVYKLVKSKLK